MSKLHNLASIQVLRGISALLVTWHHALEASLFAPYSIEPPNWLITLGACGVDLFFVISGFIMVYVSLDTDKNTASPQNFMKKRFLRIYPFYWICCLFTLLAMALGAYSSAHFTPETLLYSAFLIHHHNSLINVSWTLSYEMYFYIIFAASLLFARSIQSLMFVIAVIVAILITTNTVFLNVEYLEFFRNSIVLEFVWGLLLGALFKRNKLKINGFTALLLIICSAGLLIISSVLFSGETTEAINADYRFWAWGIPSALILMAIINWEPKKNFRNKILIELGNSSYAQYLTHIFVLATYVKLLKIFPEIMTVSQWIIVPFVILICVWVGWLAHVYCEKPILSFTRKMMDNSRKSAEVSTLINTDK